MQLSIKHFYVPSIIVTCYFLASCIAQQKQTKNNFHPDDLPPITDTLRTAAITWENQEKKISHDVYFAEYGRIERLSVDTLLLVYHFGEKNNEWDNIGIRRSIDNGETWSSVSIAVADDQPKRYSGFSTPELLKLKDGSLLLAYTGRGIPDDTLHNNLQVRISKDNGQNWSEAIIAALGRSWEPGMVQFDNGEIQLFFANEMSGKRAKGRPEQQVMMTNSMDMGNTWAAPKVIAFTPQARDGMPVPLLLNDNKGLVVFMESVENRNSPELVWTSLIANWNYESLASAANGRRWYGAAEPIWGGGAYAVQLSTGETIAVMQTEGGRKLERYRQWKKKTALVMVGNSLAKNFGSPSWPYPNLPLDEGRYFCSLFLKDEDTLVLISTRNLPDGRSEVYWKEGKITIKP